MAKPQPKRLTSTPRLSSAGAQTSGRARLERLLLQDGTKVLEAFLADVQKQARRGDATLGHVAGSWAQAVETLADKIELDAPAAQRLLASRIPGDVFQTLSTVTHQSREERWSASQLTSELRAAFSPQTGTLVRVADGELADVGMSWQNLFERTVRTESTASYSRYTERALVASGYAQKRWVAHYDQTTRPSHAEASGQTVALGAEFLVGGFALSMPGDPNAPLQETMNCRCVVQAVGPKG